MHSLKTNAREMDLQLVADEENQDRAQGGKNEAGRMPTRSVTARKKDWLFVIAIVIVLSE